MARVLYLEVVAEAEVTDRLQELNAPGQLATHFGTSSGCGLIVVSEPLPQTEYAPNPEPPVTSEQAAATARAKVTPKKKGGK